MVQSTSTRRAFSLSDANATLPLVRAIVADLMELTADVEAREARVARLLKKRSEDRRDPYEEELREIQRSLVEDRSQLTRYHTELEHVGVRVRSAAEGVIEFPSWLGDLEVNLLWSPGGESVTMWCETGDSEISEICDQVFTSYPTKANDFRRGSAGR